MTWGKCQKDRRYNCIAPEGKYRYCSSEDCTLSAKIESDRLKSNKQIPSQDNVLRRRPLNG